MSLLTSVPLVPDRGQARQWAIDELSHREYQDARPSLVSRALNWLYDHLTGVHTGVSAPARLGLVIAVVVIAAVAFWAIQRSGGLHRNVRGPSGAALESRTTTSAEHYAAADRHAAAGDWNAAVIERFRAIARELEERTVLTPQRGRTADEIATAAAAVVPSLAGQLTGAARSFDDVRYGGHDASQQQDGELRELATALRAVRPARPGQPAQGSQPRETAGTR